MSADTHGWLDRLAELFLTNFEHWAAGRPLLNIVDKKLGYVPFPSRQTQEERHDGTR